MGGGQDTQAGVSWPPPLIPSQIFEKKILKPMELILSQW